MARSKHLQIYQDTYRFCRELHRMRDGLPKTLRFGLGEMAFSSALRMIRGIVVANGSKHKAKLLSEMLYEISNLPLLLFCFLNIATSRTL